MKITLEVSEKNEGTESPWWAIINPTFGTTGNPERVAQCITGPFFSREAAQNHLEARSYAFSKKAIVYCFSGYWSNQYKNAIREGTSEKT